MHSLLLHNHNYKYYEKHSGIVYSPACLVELRKTFIFQDKKYKYMFIIIINFKNMPKIHHIKKSKGLTAYIYTLVNNTYHYSATK